VNVDVVLVGLQGPTENEATPVEGAGAFVSSGDSR